MNSTRRSVGNAAIYLFANLLNAVVQFGLIPIVTRAMGPANYGLAALYLVAVSILVPMVGLSLHGLISVRYFTQSKADLARLIGIVLVVNVGLAVGILFLNEVLGRYLVPGVLSQGWIRLAVAAAFVQSFVFVGLALLQAQEQARIYAVVQVGASLAVALATLAFLQLLNGSWTARAWGHFLGYLGAAGITLAILTRSGYLSVKWSRYGELVRDCLSFGVPLLPHALGAIAIASAGQIFIAHQLGPSDVAYYALGLQFGAAFGLLADAFVKAYGPWLYRKLAEDSVMSKQQVVKGIYGAFVFFPAAAILFWFFLNIIFTDVVGSGFEKARVVLPYFCAAGSALGMYYAIANLYFFSSQNGKLATITLCSGGLSLLAMYFFCTRWGLEGVAIGYLIGQASLFLLAWVVSWRVYPLPWGCVFRLHGEV
ncbi:lipopolysaccharide biosynthesis protein [Chitinolyticbacter meiyuanensis]|uniref:lipopolysaccharide biosynthesis protein n=1 Tax=Chitinolyticbacter meiyuanensis TaxID=682798 RepID=UPI0011E5EAA0|nr:oligosaccharide flippase family protein [Chitinolyticbacter meiyuanensis]